MSNKGASLKIIKALTAEGFTAFWAGGCVRDRLLGLNPSDYDVATNAVPDVIRGLFPKTFSVGAQFGVILVQIDKTVVEVATFRADGDYRDGRHPTSVTFSTPEEDALRRDFTINGMFFNPINNCLIDYVKGKDDLQKRLIRAIGRPSARFAEDKLRMLRAIRFAARFSYTIDTETFKEIKNHAPSIHQVSAERIGEELVKIFTGPNAALALDLLSSSGLLREILPEIEAMKGVEQPKEFHPEGDVYTHTRLLLEKLSNPDAVLAFATLLHDVGKPPTFERRDRIRFNQHEHVGADMAEKICRRLKFPRDRTNKIVACVKHHMQFKDAPEMRESTLKKFISRDTFESELELHRIDCLSSHKKMDIYRFCRKKFNDFKKRKTAYTPAPFIRGDDLINLGQKPGPVFKKILSDFYNMQLENKFRSKQTALKYLKERLSSAKRSRRNSFTPDKK